MTRSETWLRFFKRRQSPASKIFTHLLQPDWVMKHAVGPVAQQGKQPQYNSDVPGITRYFRLMAKATVFDLSCRYARIRSLKGKQMPTDERITKAVFAAIDELNEQLPAGVHVEKSLDAKTA